MELVIGASGGTKLISALATIMTFNFWKNYDIKEATDAYRLHPQVTKNVILIQNFKVACKL